MTRDETKCGDSIEKKGLLDATGTGGRATAHGLGLSFVGRA